MDTMFEAMENSNKEVDLFIKRQGEKKKKTELKRVSEEKLNEKEILGNSDKKEK